MRAFILVATAALLVVPASASAQRATGRTSATSASPDAARSRVGGDGRSRAPGTATPAAPPRAPLGAPGSWAGGQPPRVLRPSTPGRPGPYRPAPYGSTPYGSRPHRPTPSYPYAPHGYAPYGYAPYGYRLGYPLAYYGYDAYVGTSYGAPSVVVVTPAIIPVAPPAPAVDSTGMPGAAAPAAPGGRLLVVGGGTGAPLLEVEAAGDTLLTLRWTGTAADVREVTLLLLDADRALLAAQTVRAAPYRAIFVRSPNAAFAGVAVTYAGGASTTTVVPLSPEGAGRD